MDTTFNFCPVLHEIVREGKAIGRSGKKHSTVSLSTENTLLTLRNLAMFEKPQRTLEIGLAFGGSALVFAKSHQDLGHTAMRQHTAIDPFQAKNWDDAGLLALERGSLIDYIDFQSEFSCRFLPKMLLDGNEETINLIYIDGSHLFEDVFIDWFYASQLLAHQGIVVFDDFSDRHVNKVVRFIRANLSQSFVPINIGQYRIDGGRSMGYKLKSALGRNQLAAFRKIGPAVRAWNSPFVSF